MEPEQAFQIVDQVCAAVKCDRQSRIQIETALQTIEALCKPKED